MHFLSQFLLVENGIKNWDMSSECAIAFQVLVILGPSPWTELGNTYILYKSTSIYICL